MKLRSMIAAIAMGLTSSAALAFHCPADMKKIDDALAKNPKLTEAQIPGFVEHVLGTLGRTLCEYGDQVLYRNTWGDGLFLVLGDAAIAARCALALQAALEQLDLPSHGLPDTLALRLGGHFGPVFETTDPVQGVTNYFGAHVSRTARIEPVTPPTQG